MEINLNNKQNEIFKNSMNKLNNEKYIDILVPVGFGLTTILLKIISNLKFKILIVCKSMVDIKKFTENKFNIDIKYYIVILQNCKDLDYNNYDLIIFYNLNDNYQKNINNKLIINVNYGNFKNSTKINNILKYKFIKGINIEKSNIPYTNR